MCSSSASLTGFRPVASGLYRCACQRRRQHAGAPHRRQAGWQLRLPPRSADDGGPDWREPDIEAASGGSLQRREQRAVAEGAFVELHIIAGNRTGERESVKRAAAAERDVGLAMRKGAASKIDIDLVKRHALALVDGQPPGEADREVPEGANHALDDPVFLRIVLVAQIFPGRGLELVLLPATSIQTLWPLIRFTCACVPFTQRLSGSLRSSTILQPSFRLSAASVG